MLRLQAAKIHQSDHIVEGVDLGEDFWTIFAGFIEVMDSQQGYLSGKQMDSRHACCRLVEVTEAIHQGVEILAISSRKAESLGHHGVQAGSVGQAVGVDLDDHGMAPGQRIFLKVE